MRCRLSRDTLRGSKSTCCTAGGRVQLGRSGTAQGNPLKHGKCRPIELTSMLRSRSQNCGNDNGSQNFVVSRFKNILPSKISRCESIFCCCLIRMRTMIESISHNFLRQPSP
ncbi:hypothetical protein BKA67DRAFT_550529 [Truncatella angustata]|uniref:Uncharacterized protein n=1 Tax=Truncatella angustata TaxID=152316 RepID=A0A9P8UZH1_9PEZI|nr:uncharacterized protein BKA67DRAFT_550529 [Truncatella angustata]KAH6661227.1 hypothetical protein BKA67DRAFT_550529 [Truncatella angustata]